MDKKEGNSKFFVRTLALEDLKAVAAIHKDAFPDSFLSLFGVDVINRYYEWQTKSPNECYPIGAFEGGNMLGFCFAGVFPDSEIGFLRRNILLIIKYLFWNPKILFHPLFMEKAKYTCEAIIHHIKKVQKVKEQPAKRLRKFGILSIAVDPDIQQSGVGRLLMAEVERIAVEKQFDSMRLSVHPDNQKAFLFYQDLGWEKTIDSEGSWNGYMQKNLSNNHNIPPIPIIGNGGR
jgi:ribosomal protein S18 acetylase RimI-like enzyme